MTDADSQTVLLLTEIRDFLTRGIRELLTQAQTQRSTGGVLKDYLGLDEAAHAVSTCPATLRAAIKKGHLKAFNVSTGSKRATWRIARTDLEEYIRTRPPAAEVPSAEGGQYVSTFLEQA